MKPFRFCDRFGLFHHDLVMDWIRSGGWQFGWRQGQLTTNFGTLQTLMIMTTGAIHQLFVVNAKAVS